MDLVVTPLSPLQTWSLLLHVSQYTMIARESDFKSRDFVDIKIRQHDAQSKVHAIETPSPTTAPGSSDVEAVRQKLRDSLTSALRSPSASSPSILGRDPSLLTMVEVPGRNHTITCTRLALLDGSHIFLRAKWFNTSFSVTAMDFPRSWSCHVAMQEVEEIASMLGIKCEEFFSQARLYLGDGISDSQYSFEPLGRQPNVMRLSWTTVDMRCNEEPRVGLFLQEDNSTMQLVPEFLNVLMDTTVIVKDLLARCKIYKSKKTRQLAMRFSASEKVRKRSLSQQVPTREGMHGGLDGLVVKSKFPNSSPKFNSSTVSYEPASGLSTPTHPPSLTALHGKVQQHQLRTPAMENLISPRQVLQSVSSTSKPMSLGVYNAGRLVLEEETVPCYGHQTPAFCFKRPNGLGNYLRVSHGQLKSLPSGYQGISENKREQAHANVQRLRALKQQGEAVQVPMADDHDYILDRVGSSKLQLPMKVDVYDGLDRVPPPKHSPEFAARLYEHGLSSWAQPRTPIRTTAVDIDSMSRPVPTFHDVAVPKNLHNTLAGDKAVLSHESRKLGMANSGGSGWINLRKSSFGVDSRNFELSGLKRRGASQVQKGVIMLSDSEEEDYHNLEVDPGVLGDEDLLDQRIPRAREGLPDEPENRVGRLNDSLPNPWRGNIEVLNMNVSVVKDERCRSRLTSGAQASLDYRSRSRKRKDRDNAHEDRTDIFDEGKHLQSNGFISKEQVSTAKGSLPRNGIRLEAQVFVPAGVAPCIKTESEQHAVWQAGDHRYGKHPNTFDYGSRAQLKPAYHTADDRSKKFESSSNNENVAAKWSTWLSELKTEVTSWEAPIPIGNSMTGGSSHVGNQPTENVVISSSPCDSKHLVTPFLLKKLDRNLDVVDFPHTDSEHLQSPREALNINHFPSEENSCRERLEISDRGCVGNPDRSHTRELGMSKKGVSSDVLELEKVKVEREFIEVEDDGDSDSVEEHVFEPGLHNDTKGMTVAGESVADMLKFRQMEKSASIRPLYGRKVPGRRGRPPSTKAQLHPNPTKSVSQVPSATRADTCTGGTPQLDKDPRNTNLQRISRTSRPVGRPKHSNSQRHRFVDVDQEQQRPVPDSDFYPFDDDRVKEKIKSNEVWALYHDVDTMPRDLVLVKEVSKNGAFWVKASWLQPHNASKKNERQKKTLYPRSCGDFEDLKEMTIFKVVNCFSHRMEFTPKLDTVIQVYPRKGEVWALHKKEDLKQGRSEKGKQGKGNEENGYFRLVVILSNCGEGRPLDILVLRKLTGYRTLWEPGYKRGSLPIGSMERFSHRVPAYKLTEKDYPDLNNSDIWDIDAAAVPECQSKVT